MTRGCCGSPFSYRFDFIPLKNCGKINGEYKNKLGWNNEKT